MNRTDAAEAASGSAWTRFLGRVRAIRHPGGASSFLRWLNAVLRRETNKRRVAWWHLQSALRSRWIRAQSRRASAVPAFDLGGYNPIGWRRDVGSEVAALGPLELLPPGVEVQRVVHRRDLRRLRRIHHLEDTSAFHPSVVARVGDLVRLAALGVIVHLADGDQRLRPLLGDDFYRLATANAHGLNADARELLSVGLRRAALREHSSWAREDQRPLVSILLATKRPAFLPWALANAARQTYPKAELILVLHGEGFADVERQVAELPLPAKVLRMPASEPLGAVLNAATAAASGTLLTKMDDDDVYGVDHLWDLVLAREYSGAQLVGKWLEFVYLAAANRTIRWFNGCGERYQTSALAGGTLLISRRDLDGVGGWRKVPSGVDAALAEDVLRVGGRVYRTHATGFMLVRHGCRHTWSDPDGADDALLAKADRVWCGFQPARADIEEPNLVHPALAGEQCS